MSATAIITYLSENSPWSMHQNDEILDKAASVLRGIMILGDMSYEFMTVILIFWYIYVVSWESYGTKLRKCKISGILVDFLRLFVTVKVHHHRVLSLTVSLWLLYVYHRIGFPSSVKNSVRWIPKGAYASLLTVTPYRFLLPTGTFINKYICLCK